MHCVYTLDGKTDSFGFCPCGGGRLRRRGSVTSVTSVTLFSFLSCAGVSSVFCVHFVLVLPSPPVCGTRKSGYVKSQKSKKLLIAAANANTNGKRQTANERPPKHKHNSTIAQYLHNVSHASAGRSRTMPRIE